MDVSLMDGVDECLELFESSCDDEGED